MVNVFFSHSSIQKQKVEAVVSKIGRDFSIVDKYAFESGEDLKDEIDSSIDKCKIFCLFVSKEIFSSDWVKYELARVRNLKDQNQIKFCAFCVDSSVNIVDLKKDLSLSWICGYLIDYIENPYKIARLLCRKMRELVWEEYQQVGARERLFLGREDDLKCFDQKFYERIGTFHNTYILAGLPNVGRKRFIKQVIRTKLTNNLHPSYEPLLISLSENDYLFEFVSQLNESIQLWKKDELLEKLHSGMTEKDIALRLIKMMVTDRDVLIIDDNRSVINTNGGICDWFEDLVMDENMPNSLSIFVATTINSPYPVVKKYPMILFQKISELDKESMSLLFNAYANVKGIQCSKEDADYLIRAFTGFPEQAYSVVDEIVHSGMYRTKLDLNLLMRVYDRDLASIYDRLIEDDDDTKNLLVIMSMFEFVSYDFLCQLIDVDTLNAALDKMEKNSVYDVFGTCNQYLRLNQSLSDFINRNHIKLDWKLDKKLKEETRKIINSTEDDVLDLSEQLFKIKEIIRTSGDDIDSKYLVPSYALKVIVDEYKHGHNKNVISVADKILNGYKQYKYGSVEYALRYWKCLALCKENDDKLFEEAKLFKSDYTYNFLLGFYYRFSGKFDKAETYFTRALECAQSENAPYKNKAEHELVIARVKNHHYDEALDLARKCYERNSRNTYFIEAYFRCIINSRVGQEEKIRVVDELIDSMKKSYEPSKDFYVRMFEIQKSFYFENKDIKIVLEELEDVIRIWDKSYPREVKLEINDKLTQRRRLLR